MFIQRRVPDALVPTIQSAGIALRLFDVHPSGYYVFTDGMPVTQEEEEALAELLPGASPGDPSGVDLLRAEPDVMEWSLKLYDYFPDKVSMRERFRPPADVVWTKALTLRPQRIATAEGPNGEVREWCWYGSASIDPATGLWVPDESTHIVTEVHSYARLPDEYGVPLSRTENIYWIRRNGEQHPGMKTRVKNYDFIGQAKEGQVRRQRLLDDVLGRVGAWLYATLGDYAPGQALAVSIDTERRSYIYDSSRDIVPAIQGASADIGSPGVPWLDSPFSADPGAPTVRQFMVDRLRVWEGAP